MGLAQKVTGSLHRTDMQPSASEAKRVCQQQMLLRSVPFRSRAHFWQQQRPFPSNIREPPKEMSTQTSALDELLSLETQVAAINRAVAERTDGPAKVVMAQGALRQEGVKHRPSKAESTQQQQLAAIREMVLGDAVLELA